MTEMGMFDTLYDEHGNDWQTKAFDRNLDEYAIGDTIPADCSASYQVEILGGSEFDSFIDSFATIRAGVLASVHVDRDPRLPLLDYGGHLTPATASERNADG